MSRTYKATGINLKAMPLGESDRLLTILTVDHGLVKVIAPGARKQPSRLGGRTDLFVINEILVAKGKQLDKLTQAETVRSFPSLAQHLGKLTASQYLAEIVLFQALSDCPQEALFYLFVEHLERIEASTPGGILACLCHGIYHLLALAGVAPDMQNCCVTREPVIPQLANPDWRIGFSAMAGGIFQLSHLGHLADGTAAGLYHRTPPANQGQDSRVGEPGSPRWSPVMSAHPPSPHPSPKGIPVTQLNALELILLQQLSRPELCTTSQGLEIPGGTAINQPHELWVRIERLLRQYAQYHFDRSIRSALLIDTCFPAG